MRLSIISILLIIFNVSAFASDDACKEKLKGLMQTRTEKYLFERHPGVIELFQLNCDETDYGNNLITSGAMVFVHEAAHFEDLDWTNTGRTKTNFNLYTVNDEHIGDYKLDQPIPQPMDLINPYIEKNKPDFLNEGSVYMSMHDGYLLDDHSGAAQELRGMATELNGYTHGSIIQARTSQMIADELTITDEQGNQHTLKNPFKGQIHQLDGMMYFIYNQNLYLSLLKEQHPDLWLSFYSEHNKIFMRKMLLASIETLKKVNHCKAKETYYNVQFYIDELKQMDLSILNDILDEKSLKDLLCIQEKSAIKDIEKLNGEIERTINSVTQSKNCK